MRTLKKIVFTGLFALIACAGVAQAQELYKDEKAPMHERIMDLLSRLTVEEKISLLRATSPGIPRLDIPKYYHGNEALHGVVRPGTRNCNCRWLRLFLMRHVPVGTNWIRDGNKKASLVTC